MACFASRSITGRERPSEGGRVVLGITVHAACVVFCLFLIFIELFEPLAVSVSWWLMFSLQIVLPVLSWENCCRIFRLIVFFAHCSRCFLVIMELLVPVFLFRWLFEPPGCLLLLVAHVSLQFVLPVFSWL